MTKATTLTRDELVRLAFDRGATGASARHFYFWLGGAARDKEPESRMLLELFLADEITADEAASEEPAKWVRLVQDLELDARLTPSAALAIWRGLSATERRLIVEKFDRERAERIRKRQRTEPTRADRDRLARGAE